MPKRSRVVDSEAFQDRARARITPRPSSVDGSAAAVALAGRGDPAPAERAALGAGVGGTGGGGLFVADRLRGGERLGGSEGKRHRRGGGEHDRLPEGGDALH